MSLIIKNAAQFMAGMALYKKSVEKLTGGALFLEAELIMGEAKEITPVDTGTLRSSGFVEKPKQTVSGFEVTLGFGGPASPYAFTVHETHKTQSKYLEKPLNKAKQNMDKRIAKRVDSGLKKRGF